MTRAHLLSAIIVSTILLPWIAIAPNFPELRPEWFLLLAGLALLRVRHLAVSNTVVLLGVVVTLTYLLSIVVAMTSLGSSVVLRDFTELFKPVLYSLLFIFIASGSYRWDEFSKVMQISIAALVVASIITIIQFFAPDSIARLLLLYRPDPDGLESYRTYRSWGTMGNPNDMGFVAVLTFGVVLFSMKYRLFPGFINWTFLAIGFIAVFLTGSRTAMLVMAAILGYFLFFEMKKSFKSIFIVGVLFICTIWMFNSFLVSHELLSKMATRILSLGDIGGGQNAWVARVNAAKHAMGLVMQNPIVGHGPSKSQFLSMSNVDNEYVLLLFRFGLLGMFATVVFIWVMATRITKTASPIHRTMKNLSFALLGASALFAYTAGTYGQFRIMFLLIVFWTLPVYLKCIYTDPPIELKKNTVLNKDDSS